MNYEEKRLRSNKQARDWHHNLSPEKRAIIAKKESEYQTKHYITTYRNGKTILLKGIKRDKPKDLKCELCNRECTKMHLQYHHYDDKDLMKGLWLCSWCHSFAERFDKGFSEKYAGLKEAVCKS